MCRTCSVQGCVALDVVSLYACVTPPRPPFFTFIRAVPRRSIIVLFALQPPQLLKIQSQKLAAVKDSLPPTSFPLHPSFPSLLSPKSCQKIRSTSVERKRGVNCQEVFLMMAGDKSCQMAGTAGAAVGI